MHSIGEEVLRRNRGALVVVFFLFILLPTFASAQTYTRPLTLGSEGSDVSQLQTFLIAAGYFIPAGATGYFGTQTESALAAYQRDHAITPALGYYGPLTEASMRTATTNTPASTEPLTSDLQLNDSGPDVITLQTSLLNEGYTIPAGATGHFGIETYQALLKYQAAHNLPATGYFGPLTRATLTTTTSTTSVSASSSGSSPFSPYIDPVTGFARIEGGGAGAGVYGAPTTSVSTPAVVILPTVSLTAPTNGATVSGTVTLSAAASSSNATIASVSFYLDGTLIATASTSPYTYSLDSTTITDGTHTITAVARDSLGNSRTSSAVSITSANTLVTIALTSGSTWTVPSDWNSAVNTIEAIGAGGNGASASANAASGAGGGGGEFMKVSDVSLTPGAVLTINIPSSGAGSSSDGAWLKNGSGTKIIEAENGGNATGVTAGAGGTGGTGDTGHDGGTGGTGYASAARPGGGGGGAGGPNGAGGAGGYGQNVSYAGAGGGGGADGGAGGSNTSNATSTLSFSTNSTWTAPTGVESVLAECWAGGGGGVSGYTYGGAGGGAYSRANVSVTGGTVYPVIVGQGGAGRLGSGAYVNGYSGGDSMFAASTTLLAKGGAGSATTTPGYGLGGQASSGVGDVKYSGGNGGIWRLYNAFNYTGPGGGGAGNGAGGANGNSTGAPTGALGGSASGGSGGTGVSTGAGNSGSAYGGGASSGRTNSDMGGSGGNGFCDLAYSLAGIGASGGNGYGGIGGGSSGGASASAGTGGGGAGANALTAGQDSPGGAGAIDTSFDSTDGAGGGGGGGGGGDSTANGNFSGGAGGTYGGGGGGAGVGGSSSTSLAGGAGGQGIIFITYRAADTQPPTVPGSVTAVAESNYVHLTWSASTDNIRLTGYRVYRGATLIATTTSTSYDDTTTAPSTSYTYSVSAYDSAGNESAQASASPITTAGAMLSINATSVRQAINPMIYGYHYGPGPAGPSTALMTQTDPGALRWGGDQATTYNWQTNTFNQGSDSVFYGGSVQTGDTAGIASQSVDEMISSAHSANSNIKTVVTIPTIPYLDATTTRTCSWPVSVYGTQNYQDNGSKTGYVCGNGVPSSGSGHLTDTNIYSNYIDNSTTTQAAWITHLIGTFGTAGHGGVDIYELDNEPGGWDGEHWDIEPNNSYTYGTIASLDMNYADMIKAQDPGAQVLGPSDYNTYGWVLLSPTSLLAGPYFLQQFAQHDTATGVRHLDYFDEHYFVGESTSPSDAFGQLRTWYDPTYTSGPGTNSSFQYLLSGNATSTYPIDAIHTWQNWVSQYYPGTKISVSEYHISDQSPSNPFIDALVESEALGIFGYNGLQMANLLDARVGLHTNQLTAAFDLYRNYDGNGAQFGDESITSTTASTSAMVVFGATRSSDGALTIMAINQTASEIDTALSVQHFSGTTAHVYSFSNANSTAVVDEGTVPVTSNTINYDFPAYSATLFVIAHP